MVEGKFPILLPPIDDQTMSFHLAYVSFNSVNTLAALEIYEEINQD
jgi:hypothetical protein